MSLNFADLLAALGLFLVLEGIAPFVNPAGVKRALAQLLRAKTVHVPPGSGGVRVRIEIVAERALPAGEKHEAHTGAVPDDVPESRLPTPAELDVLRGVLDPGSLRDREVRT